MKEKNIGVFCASSDQLKEVYQKDALALGNEIARRSWGLVYGGTNCGLMRKVADATLECGGKVTGIIPQCICDKGIAATHITELIVASDMKERKQMLREYSDAFIALPGGWGTLEEITEVITLKQLGVHDKPIAFINTDGFYDLFFRFIENIRQENFVSPAYDQLYRVVGNAEEAMDYIESYRTGKVTAKYQANSRN